jgi:hypothetical protein
LKRWLFAIAAALVAASAAAIDVDVLTSVGAIPPEIAGRIREARGFQQSDSGQYFIFDRRGHTVFGVDERRSAIWEIVQPPSPSPRMDRSSSPMRRQTADASRSSGRPARG